MVNETILDGLNHTLSLPLNETLNQTLNQTVNATTNITESACNNFLSKSSNAIAQSFGSGLCSGESWIQGKLATLGIDFGHTFFLIAMALLFVLVVYLRMQKMNGVLLLVLLGIVALFVLSSLHII